MPTWWARPYRTTVRHLTYLPSTHNISTGLLAVRRLSTTYNTTYRGVELQPVNNVSDFAFIYEALRFRVDALPVAFPPGRRAYCGGPIDHAYTFMDPLFWRDAGDSYWWW